MEYPRTFHRIWLGEPEESCRFNPFWRRFKELHPEGWDFVTWSRYEDVRVLIDDRRILDLWDRFVETDPFGRIPDIARYHILREFGGVYVDTDVEPLRAWDPLVEDERPFICWEDDRECSTSILASPPGHPAIRLLVDNLPAWQASQARRAGTNPVKETGPRYATAQWRTREDVRRFPPVYMLPVHWRQMPDLHPPYPDRSFCVHHWASGWKSAKEKEHVQSTSLVGEFSEEERARLACYMPEAQLVCEISQAEGDYVAETSGEAEVALIRRATRTIKDSRGPVRIQANGLRVWRRDTPTAPVLVLG